MFNIFINNNIAILYIITMYFCPNCNNLFSIFKYKQIVDSSICNSFDNCENYDVEMNDIIDVILNENSEDNEELLNKYYNTIIPPIDIIVKINKYIKLNNDNKEIIKNKILDINNLIHKSFYFACENCKFFKPIKEKTLILGTDDNNIRIDRIYIYKKLLKSNTLPFTKNYICPNNNCPTHKNKSIKEAIFFREEQIINDEKSFYMVYVCSVCETYW